MKKNGGTSAQLLEGSATLAEKKNDSHLPRMRGDVFMMPRGSENISPSHSRKCDNKKH